MELTTGRRTRRLSYPMVFVVDEDVALRDALTAQILASGWRAESFESLGAFLSRPRFNGARCMLLDVELQGIHGLEVQQILSFKDLPVVFYSRFGEIAVRTSAVRADLSGPQSEARRVGRLFEAIRLGLRRSHAAFAAEQELEQFRNRLEWLSNRERQVMTLVVTGLRNKEVARRLGISEITVKAHRGCMMRKMAARSLPQLVRIADRLGVVAPLEVNRPARNTTHEVAGSGSLRSA